MSTERLAVIRRLPIFTLGNDQYMGAHPCNRSSRFPQLADMPPYLQREHRERSTVTR
jgi:hypothetical protein